ncbi:unnamed protein product [Thelazia callipaeda]|uniref:Uncharacterized protein n=1 Tax=Thelazia callipaeda TaxID=103827 RepID=A0A0N5CQK6_THECL|nr:unnamed protein product [Thelazia callipaeda]
MVTSTTAIGNNDNTKVMSSITAHFWPNVKGQLTTGNNNINTASSGYYIDSEIDSNSFLPVKPSTSTKYTEEGCELPKIEILPEETNQNVSSSSDNLQFTGRIQNRTNFCKPKHLNNFNDVNKNYIPVIASNNGRSRSESRTFQAQNPSMTVPKKALSMDAVNVHSNSLYLMEALETLGDVQPRVARSIPKHAAVNTEKFAAHSLDNCLFDATVYDAMLYDSLKVRSLELQFMRVFMTLLA